MMIPMKMCRNEHDDDDDDADDDGGDDDDFFSWRWWTINFGDDVDNKER